LRIWEKVYYLIIKNISTRKLFCEVNEVTSMVFTHFSKVTSLFAPSLQVTSSTQQRTKHIFLLSTTSTFNWFLLSMGL